MNPPQIDYYHALCACVSLPFIVAVQILSVVFALFLQILKDVKFPMTLDLFEFCTKELQDKLLPEREKSRLEDEAKAMAVKCRRITSVSEKGSHSL